MQTAAPGLPRAEQALQLLLPAAAWACYAPLGLKYAAWLAAVALAAATLHRRRSWAAAAQLPGAAALLGLFAWMALSALWSPAPWPRIGTHLWMYGLPLGALVLATACPRDAARRALAHFVAASALVGLLSMLHAWGALPDAALWHSMFFAEGNQRIVTSVLLALGAALAAWMAAGSGRPAHRAWWLAAGALAAAGLATQDRRTGILLLPVLLCAWALLAPRRWAARSVLATLVALGALGVWSTSDSVRARFAEGVAELRGYVPGDDVATSWGQRLRMVELTAGMVHEHPLVGHGLGSWPLLWKHRVTAGTLLAGNTTPHNEYLLVAVQSGLPGGLLLVAWLGLSIAASVRSGGPGVPALMVWLALALSGLVHAVLRDAKFALPLLLLAATAAALHRPASKTLRY